MIVAPAEFWAQIKYTVKETLISAYQERAKYEKNSENFCCLQTNTK